MVRFACSEVSLCIRRTAFLHHGPDEDGVCRKTSTRALWKDRKDNTSQGSMNDGTCRFGSSSFVPLIGNF